MIEFGREICGDLAAAEQREWLVTNGRGSYASGTVAGLLTRRYHGLLVAALAPPLGRTLLVAKLDETAEYGSEAFPLATNRWSDGTVDPRGYRHIEHFQLEGTTPVWRYACADALLGKRVWISPGEDTTHIRYDLRRASSPVTLDVKVLVNYRDFHGATRGTGRRMRPRRSTSWPIAPTCGLRMSGFTVSTWPGSGSACWRTGTITSMPRPSAPGWSPASRSRSS